MMDVLTEETKNKRDEKQKKSLASMQRDYALDATERDYIETVFKKYRQPLFRYLYSLTRSNDDAQDLLQETYLRVARRRTLDALEANIRGYLFTVATNIVRDFTRKKITHHHKEHISISDIDLPSGEAAQENILIWQETLGGIKRCLMEMDERPREIFIMRRYLGMTTTEIAEKYDVTKRTVERDLRHVMSVLQTKMESTL